MKNREVSTPVASAAPVAAPVTPTVPAPSIAPIYPRRASTERVRQPRPKPIIHVEKQNESIEPEVHYPESDDMPMAENTEQYTKLTTIKGNVEYKFKSNPNVFIAGDLFWYPVKGRNDIVYAPDVMIAFGRPKGKRGSYRQWEEGNIPPQIVFEIWSPGNSATSKKKKFAFYEKYGVEEYYTYDPDKVKMEGWLRKDGKLEKIPDMMDWRSPYLDVKFTIEETPDGPEMQLYHPDGTRFLSHEEDIELRQQEAAARAEAESKISEEAAARAEAEAQLQEEAAARAEAESKINEEASARAEAEAQTVAVKAEAESKINEEASARAEAEAQVQEEVAARAEAEAQTVAVKAEAESKINEEAAARAEAEAQVQEEAAARAAAEAEAERTQALLRAALEQLQKAGLSLPDGVGL